MYRSSPGISAYNEYMDNIDWVLKENANFGRSYSGLQAHIANAVIKDRASMLYDPEVMDSHYDGYLHVHNMSDGIIPYCYGMDLKNILLKGIRTDRIVTKPAKHFDAALDHIVNVMCTSQQEWAGAQAISDVNTLLAPFVRGMPYNEIKQNIQRFVYNSNFPSRSGYQTVFSNVIMNLMTPQWLIDEDVPVIIGGEPTGDIYSDYEEEADLILRAFAEVMLEGDAMGNVFTFPIPTVNVVSGYDYDNETWRKIIESDIKYGVWYYFNYWGTGIKESTVRAMCCRVNIDLTQLASAGGRWAFAGGTGSIGVVTLNMSRIGYIAKDETQLFAEIDRLLEIAKRALIRKGEIVEKSFYQRKIMPISMEYGVNFKNFFRTIGVLGLNEMVVNFTGQPLSANTAFVSKVLDHINAWIIETQKETGYLWNLEMTPGEGAATRLAFKDKEKYGDIFTQGTNEAPYLSNLLIPPSETVNIFDRVSIEQDLLRKFSGGTIFRHFLGEDTPDVDGMSKLVMRLGSNTRVPYYDLAATFSICPSCGTYQSGKVEECRKCGTPNKIFSRVVGYYRDISKYNVGKLQEFEERTYAPIIA